VKLRTRRAGIFEDLQTVASSVFPYVVFSYVDYRIEECAVPCGDGVWQWPTDERLDTCLYDPGPQHASVCGRVRAYVHGCLVRPHRVHEMRPIAIDDLASVSLSVTRLHSV